MLTRLETNILLRLAKGGSHYGPLLWDMPAGTTAEDFTDKLRNLEINRLINFDLSGTYFLTEAGRAEVARIPDENRNPNQHELFERSKE